MFTFVSKGAFVGTSGSEFVFRVPHDSDPHDSTVWSCKFVALVGLGKERENESRSFYSLGNRIARLSAKYKDATFGVLPTGMKLNIPLMMHGIYEAAYHDMRFRIADESNGPKASVQTRLTVYQDLDPGDTAYEAAHYIASGVQLARDLVGAPSNAKTPLVIASTIQEMAKQHGLEYTVLGEEECLARGMGAYLAVQQGSKFPPQFIHVSYKPLINKRVKKIVLIGKGLTFDSGGYNLKVGNSQIEMMKTDMGGLAAVMGCAKAIGQLRPNNVEVHFLSAVCENMVSANAIRPGDVVTASNGKTIEVVNTDAEGRLTLADALVYAESLGNVDAIVDLATLTGACIVGLGDKVAGLYSSDKVLLHSLIEAAQRTDEKVWNLPLEDSYRERIKSPIANIRNLGGSGGGGSITAALFLQEFVDKMTPWAHIDIAGPVWDDKSKKPTGFGVKMLVDYLLNVDSEL